MSFKSYETFIFSRVDDWTPVKMGIHNHDQLKSTAIQHLQGICSQFLMAHIYFRGSISWLAVLFPIGLFTFRISTLHNQYMRALSCSYFFGVLARVLVMVVMDYITRFSQPADIGVAQTD